MENPEKKGGEDTTSPTPKNNNEPKSYTPEDTGVKLLIIPEKQYNKMYELDISKFVERRGHGSFTASYLSWAHAARLLYTNFKGIHADIERDESGSVLRSINIQGEDSFFVSAYLTNGIARTPSIFFPIMDKMFKPVRSPNVRDISDSIQRAKVKAIAEFTGIGLVCYAGEDVPNAKEIETTQIVNEADRVEPVQKDYSKTYPQTPDKDKIFLSVPYPEKDRAKEAGARWDKENKKWYCTAETLADCMEWTDKASDVEQRLEEGGIAKDIDDQPHGGISPKAQKKAEKIAEEILNEQDSGDTTDPDLNEDVPF